MLSIGFGELVILGLVCVFALLPLFGVALVLLRGRRERDERRRR